MSELFQIYHYFMNFMFINGFMNLDLIHQIDVIVQHRIIFWKKYSIKGLAFSSILR